MPQYCIDKECKGTKDGKKTRANYGFAGKVRAYCARCRKEGMIDLSGNKTCEHIFEDGTQCPKSPSFNVPGNKTPKYCQAHADKGMIGTRSIICKKCDKNLALYNVLDNKTPIYCRGCKDENMVPCKKPLCHKGNHLGSFCNSDKSIWSCKKHIGDATDFINPYAINCQGKKEDGTNCGVRASFGPKGGKIKYCKAHKHLELNMISLSNPMCQHTDDDGDCDEYAHYNLKGLKRGIYCHKHKKKDMLLCNRKMCDTCGIRYARYAIDGEEKPSHCHIHKEDDMISFFRPICKDPSCKELANHNYEGFTTGVYCERHVKDGMSKIGLKCIEPKCPYYPSFNYEGETKRLYCKRHAPSGMINLKTSGKCKCEYDHYANYNYPGEKAAFCAKCKEPGMINVNSSICEHENCNGETVAAFNTIGETKGKFCKEHADPDMIDVIIKRCSDARCSEGKLAKGAYYGYPGQKKIYCWEHKIDGMIFLPKRKCIHPECTGDEYAIFGINSTHASFCEEHAPEDYVCVINHACKSCNLVDITDDDGNCASCNPNNFNNRLVKQRKVINWLNINGHIDYESIDACPPELTECKEGKKYGYRPDVFYDMGTHFVIVEIDENQHDSDQYRTCDLPRMINIQQSLALPAIFIRYNPDAFKIGGKTALITQDKRLSTLISWITHAKSSQPTESLQVVYLYYNEFKDTEAKFIPIDILAVAKSLTISSAIDIPKKILFKKKMAIEEPAPKIIFKKRSVIREAIETLN